MSLPPQIGTFRSGVNIQQALSAAFSPSLNPRGLEANFTPAWIATLGDAISFSHRLSVATEPYLSIPGQEMHRLQMATKHRQLLERRQELDHQIKREEEMAREPTQVPAKNIRKSIRVQQAMVVEKQARAAEMSIIDDVTNELQVKIYNLNKRNGPDESEGNGPDEPDYGDFSFETSTVADDDAQDSKPDVSIAHIVGGYIDEPTLEYVNETCPDIDHEDIQGLERALFRLQTQRRVRAGIKTVHRCAVLIGEFKSVIPSRSKIELLEAESTNMLVDMDLSKPEAEMNKLHEDWTHPSEIGISRAVDDLMYYLAAYFFVHPLSLETIALASSGPFWKWMTIFKSDTVEYDWLSKRPIATKENLQRKDAFEQRFFVSVTYLLASPESDEQINLMAREMARIASQCDKTLPILPTDLNFELIPDGPRASLAGIKTREGRLLFSSAAYSLVLAGPGLCPVSSCPVLPLIISHHRPRSPARTYRLSIYTGPTWTPMQSPSPPTPWPCFSLRKPLSMAYRPVHRTHIHLPPSSQPIVYYLTSTPSIAYDGTPQWTARIQICADTKTVSYTLRPTAHKSAVPPYTIPPL
ncbi:hypothetical protein HYPSUDRAFT_206337 [Hypholoma sublateritium FD-334 SS-4]|uniref:Uncharacterized protein n=1 Tax=Hypholoma sublateritium (strain FD-334 SS-4) TaxID=945553 RepID=A0A0D2NE19_HYPSF|nr:hypothetical protein HYPSUDRAFT_206337 [Hypholoma sublateritium FD-334 SS-4]